MVYQNNTYTSDSRPKKKIAIHELSAGCGVQFFDGMRFVSDRKIIQPLVCSLKNMKFGKLYLTYAILLHISTRSKIYKCMFLQIYAKKHQH